MWARLRHLGLALHSLPGLLLDAQQRTLLREMLAFCRSLPAQLDGPLPDALARLTPNVKRETGHGAVTFPGPRFTDLIRDLADLAALLDHGSPLGLCLRRSLTRYHFLRRAGLPVVVHFGARLLKGRPDRAVCGHAWLTLDGRPYFEDDENWRGFTAMFAYPSAVD